MKLSVENMNIALVHDWITNVAGGEKVVLALHEIFPDAPVYTSVYDPKKAKAFAGLDVRPSFLQKFSFLKSKREFLAPFTPLAFEQHDFSKYDLVISSSSMAAKGIITKPETVHICYCHTPARYLWEPKVDPRASKGWLSGLRNKTAHELRIWDRLAADRVDYFIANSHYIAKRIKKYYRKDATVIYPPVDISQFNIDENIKRENHFLFVSRLVDYKKCDIVIQAFNKLGLKLKIVGYGPDEEKLKKIASKNIEFLGPKFGGDLALEYQKAKALLFAAEEDFGIVPIESMACGCPVIAYGGGGVAESIINKKTGLFFPEQTPESIIDAVKSFNQYDFDPSSIRNQALNYSKEIFKQKINSLLEKVIRLNK